jgi:glycosyltransferase involved in cell wall biosynthesis
MPDTSDLIFVSLENWDDVWRRNQFLCAGLAKRNPARRILFVGLSRDISHELRRGHFSSAGRMALRPGSERLQTVPCYPNITVFRPLKLAPNTLGAGRRLNEALLRLQLHTVARQAGIRPSPVLWLNDHAAVHLADRVPARQVIYDITDDWTELSQSPALTELIRGQDAALCRRADSVIVCSEKLFELKRGVARNLHLVPNGVDVEHYRSVLSSDTAERTSPVWDWRKPVLGYTGTLHPDRVDVALLLELARRFSHGTIALVGPNHLTADDQARLKAAGNVVVTGPVAYKEIPDYMRAFDVCITPHRMTPFTESLNPIKLWEYLAAGKPIVSTDVAGFRDYPDLVHIARDAESFAQGVQKALAEDRGVGALRQEVAQNNSWQMRLDSVEGILRSGVPEREDATLQVTPVV